MTKKSALRIIKRFYQRLYIKEFPKLVKIRFVNLEFTVILNSMKDFVRKYIQTEHIDELALYLVVLFNFKSKVPTEYDQEPVERAKDFRIL